LVCLFEFIQNKFIYTTLDVDLILKLSDTYTDDYISIGGIDNPDIPRIIRYLTSIIAALAASSPMGRVAGLGIALAGKIIADVISNEEKANYWIDQYNFF
jgi:hypothetical protein